MLILLIRVFTIVRTNKYLYLNVAVFNLSRCASDCFELERYVNKNKKKAADFSFLGKDYHFQILNFTESEKEVYILKLKYNEKKFILDESSYGDYPIDHHVGGNVYVKFRYLNNVITITLFNKDE